MKFINSITKPVATGLTALIFAAGCGSNSNPITAKPETDSPTSFHMSPSKNYIRVTDADGIDTVDLITRNINNPDGNITRIPGYGCKDVDVSLYEVNDSGEVVFKITAPRITLRVKDSYGNRTDSLFELGTQIIQ